MWLQRLDISGIRNLQQVRLELPSGVVGFFGANGAGKTSILEAVYVLSCGRSFRAGTRADYLNRETRAATIFGEVVEGERVQRLGVNRSTSGWEGRLDGDSVATLEALARVLAVQVFHPRLHQLIEGAPDERRRFLDFGVFHVEQGYFRAWREYRRALKQRNAALRQGVGDRELRLWEPTLIETAAQVAAMREGVVAQLDARFGQTMQGLAPELGALSLSIHPGWPPDESLAEVLARNLEGDRNQGHTRSGPHRADLKVRDDHGALGGVLSRGQQKTVVLGLTLAMHALVAEAGGRQVVLCIDDFSSELDEHHQHSVFKAVAGSGAQVLLTGVERPRQGDFEAMFHVEHGRVEAVL